MKLRGQIILSVPDPRMQKSLWQARCFGVYLTPCPPRQMSFPSEDDSAEGLYVRGSLANSMYRTEMTTKPFHVTSVDPAGFPNHSAIQVQINPRVQASEIKKYK